MSGLRANGVAPVRAVATALALAVLFAATPAPSVAHAATAHASKKAPSKVVQPGDPGSSQYQEDVPSAFGSVPASSVASNLPPAPTGALPGKVVGALANDGAPGRAAASLAAAGTPAKPARASHRHTAVHHTGSGGSGKRGGGTGNSGGSLGGTAAVAQAGSGKGILASLADSIVGSDGGIGALLPILLIASVLVVAVIALRRRRRSR